MTLDSTLTCPSCGKQTPAVMPEDRCLIVFTCPGCGGVMRPRAGDCCVFCSYGTERCPPEQIRIAAGRGGDVPS